MFRSEIMKFSLRIQVEDSNQGDDETWEDFKARIKPRIQDVFPVVRGSARASIIELNETRGEIQEEEPEDEEDEDKVEIPFSLSPELQKARAEEEEK